MYDELDIHIANQINEAWLERRPKMISTLNAPEIATVAREMLRRIIELEKKLRTKYSDEDIQILLDVVRSANLGNT